MRMQNSLCKILDSGSDSDISACLCALGFFHRKFFESDLDIVES